MGRKDPLEESMAPGRQRPVGSESHGELPGTGSLAPQRPPTGDAHPAPPQLTGSFPAPTRSPGSWDFRERADQGGKAAVGLAPSQLPPTPAPGLPSKF